MASTHTNLSYLIYTTQLEISTILYLSYFKVELGTLDLLEIFLGHCSKREDQLLVFRITPEHFGFHHLINKYQQQQNYNTTCKRNSKTITVSIKMTNMRKCKVWLRGLIVWQKKLPTQLGSPVIWLRNSYAMGSRSLALTKLFMGECVAAFVD